MPAGNPTEYAQQRTRSIDRRRFLRPLKSGEIMDLAARMYQVHARRLLKYSFGPMLLCYLAILQVVVFVLPGMFETQSGSTFARQFGEVAASFAIAITVCLPLFFVGIGHSTGLATRMIADAVLGNQIDLLGNVLAARRGGWTMAGVIFKAFVVSFGILGLGLLALLAGGFLSKAGGADNPATVIATILSVLGVGLGLVAIPFGLAYFAILPVISIVEPASKKILLQRARHLMGRDKVHGSGTDTVVMLGFVCFFVAITLYVGAAMVVSFLLALPYLNTLGMAGPFGVIVKGLIEALPPFLTLWLLVPFWTCGITLIYFDRRVRLEALDIEMLAKDVLNADKSKILL